MRGGAGVKRDVPKPVSNFAFGLLSDDIGGYPPPLNVGERGGRGTTPRGRGPTWHLARKPSTGIFKRLLCANDLQKRQANALYGGTFMARPLKIQHSGKKLHFFALQMFEARPGLV